MIVTRRRPDLPRTHAAEEDCVLGRVLNLPFVLFTIPFMWLPLRSDLGLLGQICILGWATGPIKLTLTALVTDRPPQFLFFMFYLFYFFIQNKNYTLA